MVTPQPLKEQEASGEELLELIRKFGVSRRSVMRSLGVGTMMSVGAGSAVATDDEPDPPQIDAHYGYSTPDAGDIPRRLEPDHVVELDVAPPDPGKNRPPVFHFAPSGLTVDAGDVVQFTFTTPDHTITAYHPAHGFQRRVPKGVPPFSSPVINAGGAWLYQFDTEGLYDVYCGPHHVLGMAMRIVVGNLDDDEIPEYEDTFEGSEGPPPLLAPFGKESLEHELRTLTAFVEGDNEGCEWIWLTPKEILDTDALDPENIQADGTVSFGEVLDDIERAELDHEH